MAEWKFNPTTTPPTPLILRREQYVEFAEAVAEIHEEVVTEARVEPDASITVRREGNTIFIGGGGGDPDTTGASLYMVYQLKSGGVVGFDWVRAHA